MTRSPFLLESQPDEGSGAIFFRSNDRRIRIDFFSNAVARITFTGDQEFSSRKSHIVIGAREEVKYELHEDKESYMISSSALQIALRKETGALRYCDTHGNLLMQEPKRGGKWLTPKAVSRNIFSRNTEVDLGQNIDGARASVATYTTESDRNAYEAKLEFVFDEREALYGLGSHEEGHANLRGHSRELYQQNLKVVVPHLVSTRGYGILLDCCSAMTFHDDAFGSYWWADCVDELDFYFTYGATFDGVIQKYRQLTGTTPLPPKWAFGYVQSKERYVSAAEMVEVVSEYRRRRIPLDLIVLDWKSWPNGAGWGQKSFDLLRFPDPSGFAEQLHAMGARLMVSIWPIMTGGCGDQLELLDRDLMLGNQSTYNAFLSEARDCYWQQAQQGLFRHGVDAWWCDCTEPFEADWSGAVKPEPHRRFEINTEQSKLYLDAGDINAYSLMHSKGIYEGQRQADPSKRVLNLTRSSYAGQHRYGTFTWNGDVCATWETLRRSVAEGIHFCSTGEPYWTVDIGGFFIDNNPDLWFWRGDYSAGCRGLTEMNALAPDPADTGCSDLGFHELYTRWLQYAVFLPMFRSHGTDASREIWRFGEEGSPFYDAIAAGIRLRYQLLPYVYSLAAAVTFDGSSMICALGLAFPEDRATYAVGDQYLFGASLMVCPVTQPMYYEPSSQPIEAKAHSREVYLPAGALWYDARTGASYKGGQTIKVHAPLESIPWFLRAGAILPMTCVMQYVDEVANAPYELRVYTGTDGEFVLYEDAGDGYQYERGEFSRVRIGWNQNRGELTLSAREGSFSGLITEREFSVVFYLPDNQETFSFRYIGSEYRIRLTGGKEPVRVNDDEI
jgi:alpha-D-xyloside xylohydrolase